MQLYIKLSQNVTKRLDNIQNELFNETVLKRLAAYTESVILMRTKSGQYLVGSKMPAQYTKQHAKKRYRKGLQTAHVDLSFTGSMLESMRSKTQNLGFKTGYLSGLSENRSIRLASYFNETGAGRNRVFYKFIGLTDAEAEQLLQMAQEHVNDVIKGTNK